MSSAPKDGKRSARDLYITPVGVTEALLDELERCFEWGPGARPRILDVGAGTGRIAAACRAQWPDAYIVAAEIDEAHREQLEAIADEVVIGDFLQFEPESLHCGEFDLIIGNPPYSLALPFLEHCLAIAGRQVIKPLIPLLVNMNFVGSDERVDWFDAHAANSRAIRWLAPRPSFTHAADGLLHTDSVEYAWWIWSRVTESGLPPFGWYLWRTTNKRRKALLEREEVAAEQ